MYYLEHDGISYQFNETPEDDDKYIIFTCARDEEDYIKEWLDYHFSIGFDKIIVCDNNLDPKPLPILLEEYVKSGKVEIFDCSTVNRGQVKLFNMFARNGHYKWCAFIDVDEFIEISGRFDSIKDVLNECDAECLCLNWMVYGTNNIDKKEDGPVQERFKLPIMPSYGFKENMYLKSILRKTDNFVVQYKNPHFPAGCKSYSYGLEPPMDRTTGMLHYPIHYKNIYIRHYTSKSKEEFYKKQKRGWADCDDEVLRQETHINMLNSMVEIPLEEYTEGLFAINKACDVTESFGKYDVYVVKGTESPYRLYTLNLLLGHIFKELTDITVVIDESINDTQYGVFLDLAIRTGNRLIACKDDFNLHKKIYEKYHKKWNNDFFYLFLR